MTQHPRGFSVLELTIAMGIMMVITGTMFGLLNPAQGTYATQGEVSDLQQRLRVAHDALSKDIVMAGAGLYMGTAGTTGSLNSFFAPVLPYRQGAVNDDGVGKFFSDRITVFYVPSTTAQATLSADFTSAGATGTLNLTPETDCPTLGNGQSNTLCGFTASNNPQTVLIVDPSTGNYDAFTVTNVNPVAVTLTVNLPPDSTGTTFLAGSNVMEAIDRTYFLDKTNASNWQLKYYDGSSAADVPVVDHVVGLTFDYYGDQQPPQLRKPVTDLVGPWTTYGPKPKANAVKNCVFDVVAGAHVPALPVLGNGSNPNTLIKLTPAQLTDGPWCPDDTNANRWDADLLRIRKVSVTITVEAAVDALRGPAGMLFARAGTSTDGRRWIPDQKLQFQVSPRNLNLGR